MTAVNYSVVTVGVQPSENRKDPKVTYVTPPFSYNSFLTI